MNKEDFINFCNYENNIKLSPELFNNNFQSDEFELEEIVFELYVYDKNNYFSFFNHLKIDEIISKL